MSTGYISQWRKETQRGRVSVCTGDFSVGDEMAFKLDACDEPLKKRLRNRNDFQLTGGLVVPPPDSLEVSFDIEIPNVHPRATNLSQV